MKLFRTWSDLSCGVGLPSNKQQFPPIGEKTTEQLDTPEFDLETREEAGMQFLAI